MTINELMVSGLPLNFQSAFFNLYQPVEQGMWVSRYFRFFQVKDKEEGVISRAGGHNYEKLYLGLDFLIENVDFLAIAC